MERLIIEATKSSPLIDFDPENKVMKIEGQSYPENAAKFYEPVFNWLEQYFLENMSQATILDINLIYLNTSSSKIMITLFDILEEQHKKNNNIVVKWNYHIENELAKECGEEFKEDLNFPFELVEVRE